MNFEQIFWQCHCHWKHFDPLGELLSSLELTPNLFISELLVTNEIMEQAIEKKWDQLGEVVKGLLAETHPEA